MKHLKLTLFILAASVSGVWAQSVDTVAVWSQSMKKNVKNVVITPANYKTAKNERFPVVPSARSRRQLLKLDKKDTFPARTGIALWHDNSMP